MLTMTNEHRCDADFIDLPDTVEDDLHALNIRRMTAQQKRRWKAWCAMHDISMEQAAIQVFDQICDGSLRPKIVPIPRLSDSRIIDVPAEDSGSAG